MNTGELQIGDNVFAVHGVVSQDEEIRAQSIVLFNATIGDLRIAKASTGKLILRFEDDEWVIEIVSDASHAGRSDVTARVLRPASRRETMLLAPSPQPTIDGPTRKTTDGPMHAPRDVASDALDASDASDESPPRPIRRGTVAGTPAPMKDDKTS